MSEESTDRVEIFSTSDAIFNPQSAFNELNDRIPSQFQNPIEKLWNCSNYFPQKNSMRPTTVILKDDVNFTVLKNLRYFFFLFT